MTISNTYSMDRRFQIPAKAYWSVEMEFFLGQTFSTKGQLVSLTKSQAVIRNYKYKVITSNPKEWAIKCIDTTCPWRMRSTLSNRYGFWIIRQLNNGHSCDRSTILGPHPQLDVTLISDAIMHIVRREPGLKVETVIDCILEKYHRNISYRKAWFGKQRAVEKLYGDWVASYNNIETILNAIRLTNPGTRYEIRTHPAGNCRIFKSVFWAFGPCIEAFKHCAGVMIIDGTFLTGKYKQVLLMASTFDGQHRIVQLAYAIVDKEDHDNWKWFMENLQRHVTNRANITIISDRHKGIAAAMRNIDRGWVWRWCLRHYVSNFNKKHRNQTLKSRLWNLGIEGNVRKFEAKKAEWLEIHDESNIREPKWVNEELPLWSLAYDNTEGGGARWGTMTTNAQECVNGVLKGVRRLP
ncbi:hypothetical protein LINPERHAP1_LOCUS1100, partial [Linum perenne]